MSRYCPNILTWNFNNICLSIIVGKEIAGKVSLKHIYEIALIKSQDPPLQLFSMQDICNKMVGIAKSCGIEVVKDDLDPVEYEKFLEERKQIVENQKKELQEKKEAKMLRTA